MERSPPLVAIILYVHNMPAVSLFYQTYFGFREEGADSDVIHLTSLSGGCAVTILKASKGHRSGQSLVKLFFAVQYVEAFKQESDERVLQFVLIHRGEGYAFANARDPAKNLIQISSRRLPS